MTRIGAHPARRSPAIFIWWALLGTLALVWGAGGRARADSGSDQLYFVGMTQVAGSISSAGSASKRVYLRWDVTEGELPADLASFKILRNGVEVASVAASYVATAIEIQGFYDPPNQRRRRNEIVRWLNDEAAASDPPAPEVTILTFGQVLHDKLDPPAGEPDLLWTQLGSRVDFNIARARGHAYIDTAPPAGTVTYELKGVRMDASEHRLGLVAVDTSAVQTITAAGGFEQVQLSRCDLPGRFRDHGVVALDWDLVPPAMSAADRHVTSLMVAGYDLYRTTANVVTVPARDIRAEALAASHDANGNVTLLGLEKVNDQPIVISGRGQTESSDAIHTPPFSQFVETLAELAARGVKPGDTRAYYLVARDFTGNYGDTASLLVQVPDLIAPPAPWNVSTDRNTAGASFALTWPRVDVASYQADFSGQRTYCNLGTAVAERELRYAPEGSTCGAGGQVQGQVTVELDVEEYLVYRFDLWQDGADTAPKVPGAATFKDSDGDGYGDADERGADASDVGTACDPSMHPSSGATSHLVGTVSDTSAIPLPTGRKIIRFVDNTPYQSRGEVFWYRIATRGTNGNLSALSEPIRALFPDRDKPDRALLDGVGFSGDLDCPPNLFRARVQSAPNLGLPFAIDSTAGASAATFRIGCATGPTEFVVPVQNFGGVRGASLPASACKRLRVECPAAVVFQFQGGGATPLAPPRSYPTVTATDCRPDVGMRNVELINDCIAPTSIEIGWAEVVPGPVLLNVPRPECISIYRESPTGPHRLRTVCAEDWPVLLDLPNIGGESICLSLAIHSENSVLSTRERLPCYRTQVAAPPAPQPLEIDFVIGTADGETADATASWLPPEQPSVGTIVEWYEKGQGDHSTLFAPHAGHRPEDGAVTADISLSPWSTAAAWQEEWCFRARTVGLAVPGEEGEVLSPWSPELCAVRAATQPAYLPWPKIPEPPQGADLIAFYMGHAEDRLPGILLGSYLNPSCASLSLPACNQGAGLCLGDSIDEPLTTSCPLCPWLHRALGGELGFVVYRQSRLGPGDTGSEFSQVSPLIDDVFCKRECGGKIDVVSIPTLCPNDSYCASVCAGVTGCNGAQNVCNSECPRGCVGLSGTGNPCVSDADCNSGEVCQGAPACLCTCKDDDEGDHTLADPFIKLVLLNGQQPVFVDRYPHEGGRQYRYQLVYFDGNGEIVSYRTSNWVSVNAD